MPTIGLTIPELHTLIAALPRCPHAQGQNGQKVAIPVRALADVFAAAAIERLAYRCPVKDHWHITTVRDSHSPPRRARDWHQVIADAAARTGRWGRQRVYGARTGSGKWVYRAHPAIFRNDETRTYRTTGGIA